MTDKVDTMVRYSPLDIPKIIRAHWRAEPKVPANFIAEPSTVKSEGALQTARQLAKESECEFIEWNRTDIDKKQAVAENPVGKFIYADLRASETDIGELRLQDMKNGQDYITFKYNILFKALSHPEAKGILFFDEMNLAPNMIKAQFYKIINDGAVGDIPISEGVLCLSAGNEAEHSRGVTEDPVPLVLRRGNYFLRPLSSEEYTDYAVKTNHHQHIIGYLGFQPSDVHSIKYDTPDSIGQPCPRTWTKLSSILQANPDLAVEDIEMLATGLVGQGVAKKFSTYVRSAKEINLQEIIDNPESIKEYEESGDQISLVYAIIAGVVERFRDDKKIIAPAFELAYHFKRPEFGAYLLRSMKNVDEKGFVKAGESSNTLSDELAEKVVERYAKYLFQ